ncbi:SCO7613 C-terminal domain-containing membrane protein [Aeromicrobium sp.]|uniref:SCO7613 C-terminal domain-containing membrane protein n=1 Tax=Aeromicrobium sp. TaxID=1871063 RepID=UPI0039E6CA56
MRYADATRCPGCRAGLVGRPACPACGFDLTAAEIPAIWRSLEEIDALVETVRSRQRAVVVPPPAPVVPPVAPPSVGAAPVPPPVAPPILPSYPAVAAHGPPSGGGLTVGSVLLGLGAVLLIVAGIVFISRAWETVGLGGRVAILGAATAAVGALGSWVTRRELRGSAEAVWLVFACFVSADWYAACDLGLAGLDGLPDWAVVGVWAAVMSLIAVVVGAAAQRAMGRSMMTLQIVAGGAAWWFGGALADALDDAGFRLFWLLLTVGVLLAAVAFGAKLVGQTVWSKIVAVGAESTAVIAVVTALVEAFAHPRAAEYLGEGHGLPLLVVTLAIAAAAAWQPARAAAVAVALSLVALLVGLPLGEPLHHQGWYLWVALYGTALVVARPRARRVDRAAGIGTLIAAAAVGIVTVIGWSAGLVALLASVDLPSDGAGRGDFFVTTSSVGGATPLQWWATLCGGLALATALVAVASWPEARQLPRRHFYLGAGLIAAITIGAVLADVGVAVVLLGAMILAAGIALAVTGRWFGQGWEPVGHVLVALAPLFAVATYDGLIVLGAAASVALFVLASTGRWKEAGIVAAGLGTGWGIGVVALLADHPEFDLETGPVVTLVLVASLAATGIGLAMSGPPASLRLGWGVEAVGTAAVVMTLLAGTPQADYGWTVAWLSGIGAVLVAAGLLVERRAWARYAGLAFLVLAWIVYLTASDTHVLEVYTLPFAAAALGAGAVAMARSASVPTWLALGPGLLFAVVPSALLAYAGPVSVRALLVGLVAAVLIGVGLVRRWQAPFVIGGTALAILALVELAPYGWALPRWILLGAAGALLLGAGITWEDRVRDGRAAARFVGSMR